MEQRIPNKPDPSRWPRPVFLRALMAVVVVLFLVVSLIQVVGADLGEECVDSYSCRGFLVAGSECVQVDSLSYCSRYCASDSTCPNGWRCGDANPTALGFETAFVDQICLKPDVNR